ncbi:TetR/AcrR family transcriptional regulator [Leptospira sp. 201903074]|uniref:TetR/AcrR family transcriptional regulator n=1 Tax=Leptospira abararensis TaxID=2810036 RepID=UPI0019665E40|nr:TetR/AcrR family transcriptional regulator [Leptospira abararensis]MBM9546863.1 TetR/AcrR family transcriptional regulator [Leptospira abararensis]
MLLIDQLMMKSKEAETSTTQTRKAEILAAAVRVFSSLGFYKATTADIAESASISQPYIFKFFKSKEELYLAALEEAFGRIHSEFEKIQIVGTGSDLQWKMITAYEQLMAEFPEEIHLQMQAFGISELSIREKTKESFAKLYQLVLGKFQKAEIPEPEFAAKVFLSKGIFCNITLVLDLPEMKF